jgi:hypothetical protein
MRKLSYLLVIFLVAGIVSCEEVENLNKDKFTFKADGEEIDYSDRAEYGTLENSGDKIIRGRNTDSTGLMITVPEFSETRYTSSMDNVQITYNGGTNTYSSVFGESSIEVRIDSYEEGSRIEGTFSGTIYTATENESIEIKNGEFRVNN